MVGWTLLEAHVYDLVYYKVMTICVCDMMCKMADAQEQMWLSMLALLKKHGLENVNFKGFMADSAQANFNAVRRIFGSGNKNIPMAGKERTSEFHWSMVLDRHTRQLIKPELQAKHIELCHEYQKCMSKADANLFWSPLRHDGFHLVHARRMQLKSLLLG